MTEMKVGCACYQEGMQGVQVAGTIGLFARDSQIRGVTDDTVQEVELRFG